MAGIACGACVQGLRYRTPAGYLSEARRLQREGSPAQARRAWRAAALALATANAAQQGRVDLARRGLAGLRSMALADPPPVTLDRDALRAKFHELATAQATRYREALRTASAVVDIVMVPLQLAGEAISNINDRALYRTILQSIQFVIASAAGRTASLPVLDDNAIRGLVGFCTTWNAIKPLIQSGVTASGAIADLSLRDRNASAVVQVLINVVFGIGDGLCNDAQVRAAVTAATATPLPSNCATLACPPPQVRSYGADGQCVCRAQTPTEAWLSALRARVGVETVLAAVRAGTLNPATSVFARNAVAQDCATSCALEILERQLLASGAGTIPQATGVAGAPRGIVPASSTARRYITVPPAGACVCTPTGGVDVGGGSGSGGGGAGALVVALPALFYLVRAMA